jgi:hypothetical protein
MTDPRLGSRPSFVRKLTPLAGPMDTCQSRADPAPSLTSSSVAFTHAEA